ncbi:Protein of unknown function [Bacillus cereus]|nr:Protein of unknown function [Bacillus mobilis]SCN02815.1 Protein of unknown function [Bacillus cereus]
MGLNNENIEPVDKQEILASVE